MSIKKIMFYPGLVLEDFLLNRDIGQVLGGFGYQVIIFEENANYFAEQRNNMEDFIFKNKPDLFISYNLSIFSIRKQKGIMSVPLIEDMGIPYISLNFGTLWNVAARYVSSHKFMKHLKAVSFPTKGYAAAASAFGFKNISVLPIAMGYLRPKEIKDPPIINKCLIWQSHIDFGQRDALCSDLYNECLLKAKSLLHKDIMSVRALLPKEIIGTILELRFMEDLEYSYNKRFLSLAKNILKARSIIYENIPLGFSSFKSLADAVQSVPLVIHFSSVFNKLGWDSIYWQIWKAGGTSILPKTGLWENLELSVDTSDKKHIDYVVDILMNDSKRRRRYREEVLSIIEEKLSWEEPLQTLLRSVDGSL